MKKNMKILILSIIILGIIIFNIIKNQQYKIDKYAILYNMHYQNFYELFMISGEVLEYEKEAIKIKDAKIDTTSLAKVVKAMYENGMEVNNYIYFFEEYLYNKESYNKKTWEIEHISKEEVEESILKLNLRIDPFNTTSDELNEWLDKAVKEYLLFSMDLEIPKGFPKKIKKGVIYFEVKTS